MRPRIIGFICIVLVSASVPAVLAEDNPCEKYTCEQRVDEWGTSEPYCVEVSIGGQWVSCSVVRYCIWTTDDSGKWVKTCTPYDCEGEYCMWV